MIMKNVRVQIATTFYENDHNQKIKSYQRAPWLILELAEFESIIRMNERGKKKSLSYLSKHS
jgi:hypothetical protein